MRPRPGHNGGPAPWNWTPWLLDASLLAWWSADHTGLITMPGGLVSSWRDAVGGYEAVQAVGAAQPIWQVGGFGGRAVVAFDGVDDELTVPTMPAGLPTGATPCEEWYAVDQQQDTSLTSSIFLGTSGGSSNGNSRVIARAVVSGVNRARANDTNGGTGASVTQGHDRLQRSPRRAVRRRWLDAGA